MLLNGYESSMNGCLTSLLSSYGGVHLPGDAIGQAQRHDVQVYAVSVHPKGWNSRGM
jgi:hypothetical protein